MEAFGNAEMLERKSASVRAAKDNPASKLRASEHSKELWSRPGYKDRKSAATTAAWADPEKRKDRGDKISDGVRAAWSDPIKKAKRLALFNTPEHRQMLSDLHKERWARRKAAKLNAT